MRGFYLFTFLATTLFVRAQDTLTYDQCVQIALENNYGILIAKENQEIAFRTLNELKKTQKPENLLHLCDVMCAIAKP